MLAPLLVLALAVPRTDEPPLAVRIDSARHAVVLVLGPFHLPASAPGATHEEMHHAGGHGLPIFRFAWPVDGWLRGFRVAIHDGGGRPLPRRLLHHVNLLHLERRQLTQPIFERTIAAGQETDEVLLPRSLGVRIDAGTGLALLSAWANDTGDDLHDVVLELTLPYLPANTTPRPREVRPVSFDVGFRAGLTDGFDLDSGRTVHEREFILPIDGRLLAVGGHLHDYAESLSLVDVASGKVLIALLPRSDSGGKVLGVSRKLFGVTGDGLRLRAGRRYRVVAIYRNPLGRTLVDGGMAVLGGIFAPDDAARWPAVDRGDAVFTADLAGLDRFGWSSAPACPGPATPAPPRSR
jgi:hypothetical protein